MNLRSKIEIIDDEENPFLAFDDSGNKFDYARETDHPGIKVPVRAIDWLGISEPDYYD